MQLHPAVSEKLQWLESEHLPESLQKIVKPLQLLGWEMASDLEGPQLALGLQHLIDAKDCFVRAQVAMKKAANEKLPKNTPDFKENDD